jgi:hypothetical protein
MSVDPTIRRLQSDWRDLRREVRDLREGDRESTRALERVEAELATLRKSYPIAAGMTPAQRNGAVAGVAGAAVALAAGLPQIIEALAPVLQALGGH